MILGYRVTKLREGLTLSKTQLAHEVGVSMSTLTKWENGESTPTKRNLEILAIKLYTTTDYLEGIIDSPSTRVCQVNCVWDFLCHFRETVRVSHIEVA